MSEWISNNREVFVVNYTKIGQSFDDALRLQSDHSQFARNSMVSFF